MPAPLASARHGFKRVGIWHSCKGGRADAERAAVATGDASLARKFLYAIAVIIVLILAALATYSLWGQQLLSLAMVPRGNYVALPPLPGDAYADAKMWYAGPQTGRADPTLWTPQGFRAAAPAHSRPAAIFFIHPTSYLDRKAWNAPLGDKEGEARAKLFVRSQASVFASAGPVWAPKYRQATFGAFLTDRADAQRALDAAYRDVAQAFAWFLRANPKGPIILAAHSQGSLHLLRLLREGAASPAIRDRIVAVYVAGWPISTTADLPALGLPACATLGQAGCILSWQSFAEPADPSGVLDLYDATPGFTGKPRKGTPMLCTNPLTGTRNGSATAQADLGTLKPDAALTQATLVPHAVGARCDARGFLLIGDPPDLGPYVLPGNNYHVYDYGLFWANLRRDAGERLATFLKTHP